MKNITTFPLSELNKFDKIWCLVSGGIDSTYLYELLKEEYGDKVFPVNCWNPYESSQTLEQIRQQDSNFIEVRPKKKYEYKEILKKAFLNLPRSRQMKRYSKKVFKCCRVIKHNAFKKSKQFSEPNTVVISGIKYGDGFQRRLWLTSLKTGNTTTNRTVILNAPTFFHKHAWGALYCYPFRDYKKRELPKYIIEELREKYPHLNHSGCYLCPVLVRFEEKIRKSGNKYDLERLEKSIEYAKKLGVYEY